MVPCVVLKKPSRGTAKPKTNPHGLLSALAERKGNNWFFPFGYELDTFHLFFFFNLSIKEETRPNAGHRIPHRFRFPPNTQSKDCGVFKNKISAIAITEEKCKKMHEKHAIVVVAIESHGGKSELIDNPYGLGKGLPVIEKKRKKKTVAALFLEFSRSRTTGPENAVPPFRVEKNCPTASGMVNEVELKTILSESYVFFTTFEKPYSKKDEIYLKNKTRCFNFISRRVSQSNHRHLKIPTKPKRGRCTLAYSESMAINIG